MATLVTAGRNTTRIATLTVVTAYLVLAVSIPCASAIGQRPGTLEYAVRQLAIVLRDPHTREETALRVLAALGDLGRDAALAADAILDRVDLQYQLDEFVDERDFTGIPSASARALSRMGSNVVPALTRALRGRNDLVRMVAIRALGQMGQSALSAAVALRETFLETRSADRKSGLEVSLEAGLALGQIGADGFLIPLASSERHEIKGTAITALGEFTDRPAAVLPTLLVALKDADARVRQFAIASIQRLRHAPADVIAALEAVAAGDPDPTTRADATAAIATLRHQ